MSTATLNDSMLVDRVKQGDTSAMDLLFRRHRRKLYQYALGLTKHAEDANDLLAETFIRALCAMSRFQYGCSYTTWLYKILRNCFLDSVKKPLRNRTISLDQSLQVDDSEVPFQFVDESESIEDLAIRKTLSEELWKAIDLLGSKDKELIYLYYRDHYTYDEMARKLGIPCGTIKSRLNRARESLRARTYGTISYLN